MIFLLGLGTILLTWIITYYTGIADVPEPSYPPFIGSSVILIIQPLAIFFTLKKKYKSSHHLRETTEITFTNREIKISGDSFYTEYFWDKTYKVEEIENWFFVYQNSLSATLIPKRYFKGDQQEAFESLLRTVPKLDLRLMDKK